MSRLSSKKRFKLCSTSPSKGFIKGYELEFTSDALIAEFEARTPRQRELTSTPLSRTMRRAFVNELRTSGQNCKIDKGLDKYKVIEYRVVYPSGFSFRITLDPGVVEIVIDKMEDDLLQSSIEIIHRDIYGVADKIGLRPEIQGPSMHASFDVETTFRGNVLFFHNFIVDILNNQVIWSKVLGRHDSENASFVSDLRVSQQRSFEMILKDFHAGRIQSIESYAKRLLTEVFYRSNWKQPLHAVDRHEKYMILNLLDFRNRPNQPVLKRIEFRGLKTMAEARDFALVDQLLSQRLRYLARLKRPMQYRPENRIGPIVAYCRWLSEMDVSWSKYQVLVPKRLRGAVETFNRVKSSRLSNKQAV